LIYAPIKVGSAGDIYLLSEPPSILLRPLSQADLGPREQTKAMGV
jgi:hypothetical protein